MGDERSALSAFLARHEPPCPHCERRIKSLQGTVCPQCGCEVTMRGVLAAMAKPRSSAWLVVLDAAILAVFVWFIFGLTSSGHRGPGGNVCWLFALGFGLVTVRVMLRKRTVDVVPLASPPTLAEYLAETDVPCPKCGYDLRDRTDGQCPECGTLHTVESLHRDAVERAGMTVGSALKPVVTAVMVVVCGIVALGLVMAAVYLVYEKGSGWHLLNGLIAIPAVWVAVGVWRNRKT